MFNGFMYPLSVCVLTKYTYIVGACVNIGGVIISKYKDGELCLLMCILCIHMRLEIYIYVK